MQTRRHSAYEAVTNIVIGYTINMFANFLIFPHFGWSITLQQNLILGAIYTAISLTRSYLLRRAFNEITRRQHEHHIRNRV